MYTQLTLEELRVLRTKKLNEISRLNIAQLSKKIRLNSLYGALANRWFRFFDIRMAEGITSTGQFIIKNTSNNLDEYLNKLCKTDHHSYYMYNDTDSLYISLEPVFKSINKPIGKIIDMMDAVCKDKLQPQIEQGCNDASAYMNGFKRISFKREVLANTGIWTGKKRYLLSVYDSEGVRYKTPKIKVTGLQSKSTATPELIRGKLKESFEICLNGTEGAIQQYVSKLKLEFPTFDSASIAFPKGVNGITKYSSKETLYIKGTPIQVRAAILFNDLLKKHKLDKQYEYIRDGDKIKFLYLKIPNKLRENVIGFPSILPTEFGLDHLVDYKLMFEKTYLKPIENVLQVIGWTSAPVARLDDLFD